MRTRQDEIAPRQTANNKVENQDSVQTIYMTKLIDQCLRSHDSPDGCHLHLFIGVHRSNSKDFFFGQPETHMPPTLAWDYDKSKNSQATKYSLKNKLQTGGDDNNHKMCMHMNKYKILIS